MIVSASLEGQLAEYFHVRKFTLATAESCTGGLIAHRLTNVPGSSEYFLGGFVAYAYEAKVAMLGVSWDTLRAYGAVSRETVLEMARGTRLGLSASIGLSVTGIAGPGGGLPHKPVGTTWIGLSTAERDVARQYAFSGDRFQNKLSASDEALRLLIEYLEGRLS